jgi:hypothetical protein
VFTSSAIVDTSAERQTAAGALEAEGARALWFEEFRRDAHAEEGTGPAATTKDERP